MTDPVPPVLFLDIDEVLAFQRAKMATGDEVDPIATAMLRRILRDTGARIVVISTWRSSHCRCKAMFDQHGLTPYLWSPIVVPGHPGYAASADDWRVDSDNGDRAGTIRRWLAAHPQVVNWIIVDDSRSNLDARQLDRLVQADMTYGLGPREHLRAVRLLANRPADWRDRRDEGPYQHDRHTIANLARQASAAIDQGDVDAALALLSTIAGHPLAQ